MGEENRKQIRKQCAAACHFAYTRLILNYHMYYEMLQERKRTYGREAHLGQSFHQMIRSFLEEKGDLEQLDKLRSQILQEMERITAFIDTFQVYEYILNRLEKKFDSRSRNQATEEETEEVVLNLISYIADTQDAAVMNERIQSVIEQLPVRFTKKKFFALVEEGMSVYKGGPREGLSDMLYILRSEALLNRPAGMETGYEDLYRSMQEFETADYSALTKEKYQALAGTIRQAGTLLGDVADTYMLLADLINDLYLLHLTLPYSLSEVSEKQRFDQMLGELEALFETGTEKPIGDLMTKQLIFLEGKQETYFEQWTAMGSHLSQSGMQEDKELETVLWKVKRLMSGSSFMSLEISDKEEQGPVGEEFLKAQLEVLFQELLHSWEGKPKLLIRAVMAKVLSRLPVFFCSLDEVQAYIRDSLNGCLDENEKTACLELLYMLMEQEI